MSIITKMRRQRCVWWNKLGDNKFGNVQYAPAVELKCRWEDSFSEVVGPEGLTVNTAHTVYPETVTPVGGVMKLCLLSDLTDEQINSQNPERIPGAVSIKSFTNSPNLRNTRRLYTAKL